MGRACLSGDISTTLHSSGLRNIMHLPSTWAEPVTQEIYPPPFTAGGPRNIMCLPSTWAKPAPQGIYLPPFIAGRPEEYPLPSAGMGQGCLPGHIHAPNGALKYPIHALWLNSMYDIFLPTLAIQMLYIQTIVWAFPPNFCHIATCCQA